MEKIWTCAEERQGVNWKNDVGDGAARPEEKRKKLLTGYMGLCDGRHEDG